MISLPDTLEQPARKFALTWHQGKLYGKLPYIIHLDAVAAILRGIGAAPWQISAAYLHDILEDTACSPELLLAEFGPDVFSWVSAVTDGIGTRRVRQATTIEHLQKDQTGAALLKLADRLANVRVCIADNNTKLLAMYRSEHSGYAAMFEATNALLAKELDNLLTQ